MRCAGPFSALDFSFDVAATDARVVEHVERLFHALSTTATGADHHYVLGVPDGPGDPHELRLDRSRVVQRDSAEGLLASLVHDLNRRAVEACPHLLVHAGGVEHDGAGLMLPGVMEAGKTTLTAALVRAGLGYLTDEAVALDRQTLTIQPYPKPLSLDPGAWPLFPELEPHDDLASAADTAEQWQVPPDAIRPGAVGQPCAVAVIVFPRFEVGAGTELEPISRGEALVEAAKNTFKFDEQARDALDLLAEVVRAASCYRLTMGELDGAVAAITSLVGFAPARSEPAR